MGAQYRLGADIGGTFTDLAMVLPDGSLAVRKVPSTPDDYSQGIMDGAQLLLRDLGLDVAAIGEMMHGTTVATNAILGQTGARTALLTTRGFRDVLELRRVRAPELYNAFYVPPPPLVARRWRLEVEERIDADGRVMTPLDERSVRAALQRLREANIESVAVCLLHSYRDGTHERRIGQIVRQELPGVYLSLSVDVLPEIREYERTSTTVINAYLGPVVHAYLHSLQSRLRTAGATAGLFIMQSNGGVMSADAAAQLPAAIVESGPAAGVIAAHRLSQRLGEPNVITFDMGGTTAKASMIENGSVTQTTEYEVGTAISLSSRLSKGGGYALKLPVLDIAEVGAGGGSIVWIDRGGALRVGPRSAGAVPGPACYDDGGGDSTITDANVILGYLNPVALAGGAKRLVPARAYEALGRCVAEPLGMDVLDAAFGAFTVASTTMVRAVKAVSTYRGRDPREFALLAFGGNGPLFGAEVARQLGIARVIVPPAAGLFSAFGLLDADLEQHAVRTLYAPIAHADPLEVAAAFAELEQRAREALAREDRSGSPTAIDRLADLRYSGQAYELTVSVVDGILDGPNLEPLAELFGQEHERTYGHRAQNEPVELVNLRVVVRATRSQQHVPGVSLPPGDRLATNVSRQAYFGRALGVRETPIIHRADLRARAAGPIIVEEYDATTLVPPGCSAEVDATGNMIIHVGSPT